MKSNLVQEFDTVFTADAIEWCPVEGYRSFVACGTYQLIANDGEAETNDESREKVGGDDADAGSDTSPAAKVREGILHGFAFSPRAGAGSPPSLAHCARAGVPAILDMKWAQTLVAGSPTLAVATSTGKLCAFAWYVWPATYGKKAPTEAGFVEDLLSA